MESCGWILASCKDRVKQDLPGTTASIFHGPLVDQAGIGQNITSCR